MGKAWLPQTAGWFCVPCQLLHKQMRGCFFDTPQGGPSDGSIGADGDNLSEYLHPELCGQSLPGLQEKICDFVLIWAPRFVDQNCHDLPAFIEDALAQSSLMKVMS